MFLVVLVSKSDGLQMYSDWITSLELTIMMYGKSQFGFKSSDDGLLTDSITSTTLILHWTIVYS